MSRPRQVVTIAKGVELAFRLIPAGTFRMGQRGIRPEEEPVHTVSITRDFWTMETPVTQAQFAVWKKDHKSHFAGKADHPVEQVTWHEAVGFAAFVQPFVTGDWVACLPTEAEWEYACRAGTTTQYYIGDRDEDLKKVAWFNEEWGEGSTQPVRTKGETFANDFGLFDMHGNVWEWCFDEYDSEAYRLRIDGGADPGWDDRAAYFAPEDFAFASEDTAKSVSGTSLWVLRGGSWRVSATYCRAARRNWDHPDFRGSNYGFRLVLIPCPLGSGAETRTSEPEGEGRARRRRPKAGDVVRLGGKFFRP